MSRKRVSPIRQNWQMAHRINDVTGEDVQSARSTASKIRSKVKIRRFMSDDAYVRAVLKAEPSAAVEMTDVEKLQAAKRFAQEVGGVDRAMELLDLYERLTS